MIFTKLIHLPKFLLGIAACLLIVMLSGATLVNAIARGYSTSDEGLSIGMVAALSGEGDGSTVERADQNNSPKVVGVVTTYEDSAVTLTSRDDKVLVESEGSVNVYVSDVNGDVRRGDLLVVSPFKGILMKSAIGQGQVIGVADSDSDFTSFDATEYAYIDEAGDKSTKITKVSVNLNNKGSMSGDSSEQSALSKLGESVVGKQVSDIRVLAALIIFIIVLIAEGGIIYGAITSAITALGRNPLAQKVIKREMMQVILVAIGVLVVGLGAIYSVLWY